MQFNRREFLKVSALTAAGLPLVSHSASAQTVNGMPHRPLGKSGERVSLLTIGGAHIGGNDLTEEESIRIMRTAVDEGVNFFDNAHAYHGGRSEIRMGKALKDGYRDKVLLMTKHQGRDRVGAQEQLETSLRRLDVDTIDLWQFHEIIREDLPQRIYENGAIEYALEAKQQGKIRYIGFTGHHYPSYMVEMIERGFDWDTVQMPLNVFDPHFRSFEKELLPKAVEKGIGVIAMKTLAGTPGNIPNASKAASVEECLRYAMSLPVATVCSGIDSMEKLRENLSIAKNFKPLAAEEKTALLERTKPDALEGGFEPYKTSWHS